MNTINVSCDTVWCFVPFDTVSRALLLMHTVQNHPLTRPRATCWLESSAHILHTIGPLTLTCLVTAGPSLRTDPGRRCGPFPRAGRTGWSPRRAARVRSRRAEPPGCLSAGTDCRLRSWSWSSACACWSTAASPWDSDWWEEHRQTEGWGQGEGRGQRHRWGQGRGQDSQWLAVRCLRSGESEVPLD